VLVKVLAVQARMGQPLSLAEKIHIFKQKPDFVCLPEYWLLDATVGDHHRAALRKSEYEEYLTGLSDELATNLVAGTIVAAQGDRLYNTCLVLHRGSLLGSYCKQQLMKGERAAGIHPGSSDLILDVDGVRIGLMICSDVFHLPRYDRFAENRVDIIFVPTASPYRSTDSAPEKKKRDRVYFLDGARRSGAFVVKVCGVGSLFGKPLQGRSLIAAPWGILNQVGSGDEAAEMIMSETLDIAEIRDFREKQRRRGNETHPKIEKPVDRNRRS